MSILIDRSSRVVVHGLTGREGSFHGAAMLDYGTNVVAGMTPGKGGQTALDGRVPVFDTVADAVRETGADTSCIFVPAAGAPDSIAEAAAAGIKTIFCITEGIPALDMIPVVALVEAAVLLREARFRTAATLDDAAAQAVAASKGAAA